ncbi:MAG: hypothetical protein U1E73_12700 [Planctomycetota bacterium]
MADDDTGKPPPDPKKPLDRARPFMAIHNDDAIPKDAPSGDGVGAGCHLPTEFEGFEEEFLKFLDTDAPLFKTFLDVLKTTRDIAAAVGSLANWLLLIPPLIPIVGIAKIIADIVDIVLTVIDTALRRFLARLAAHIFRRAVRVLPQWVPVDTKTPKARVTKEQIVEVEGRVTRSFGNPIDVPFTQWHRWFDWNVQVRPDQRYAKVRAPVEDPPSQDGFEAGEEPLSVPGSFEIQWDTGALWHPGSAQAAAFRAGFGADAIEDQDWPPTAILWPTTDMWVWAAGRWVYDCSRSTKPKPPAQGQPAEKPRMVAMLNPCKAMATARWKAVKFLDNEFAVPAIQFMFFTCKRGGYLDHETIADKDYEFILDLPPIDMPEQVFRIAQEKEATHNTIALRPRLLHSVEKGMFEQFAGSKGPDPEITVLRPDDPKQAPQQVKVKVPCTQLGDAEAYGFVLDLGWHDPVLAQARKVLECKVEAKRFSGAIQVRDSGIRKIRALFKQEEAELRAEIAAEVAKRLANIRILGIPVLDNDLARGLIQKIIDKALEGFLDVLEKTLKLESEEWLLRVGVNGEWHRVFDPEVPSAEGNPDPTGHVFKEKPLKHAITAETRLDKQDPVSLSTNGMEFDPVGDMMRAPLAKRMLRLDGQALTWAEICDPAGDAAAKKQRLRRMAMKYTIDLLTDSTSTVMALGLDNSPLGQIDPRSDRKGPSPASNPVEIGDPEPGFDDGVQQAKFARAVGDDAVLAQKPDKNDYFLFYSLQVKPQIEEKK